MAASDFQLATFQAAFNRLKQTVSFDDACAFQSTTLKDVWNAAKEIQNVQRQRRSLRNMARLKPLLESLDKYSKTIEVLCNGTPFLPWIWAPIKLMLQLANEHSSVLDQLLDAYIQIAEALPRFDRFQNAFPEDRNLQNSLAMVYEDILEFHRSSYQFFRRGSWHIFFDSMWKDFAVRFHGILGSLARHREHVDKEASSVAILEAKQWRTQHQQYVERQEIERQDFVLQEAITWLAVEDRLQEDELNRLANLRQPGTCRWILSMSPLESWIGSLGGNSTLWLNGIPGAGKSVLVSYIIQYLQLRPDITVAYFFCNNDTKDQLCSLVLRTLAAQLLRSQPDLASHIFDNYRRCRSTPSLPQIKNLLPDLMAACPNPHIIIDGLDECSEKYQRNILAELLALVKYPNTAVRIMISSREETYISRTLQKVLTISLTDKKEYLNADIREYVRCKLAPLRDSFGDANIDKVEVTVARKAHGMFLWVRLIIKELEDRRSVSELLDAANNLPQGLHKAYGRILERIRDQYSEYSRHKAIRILEWIACSFRPLKVHEIQDGIFFEPGNMELNQETKLHPSVIEVCKPIIQVGVNKTLAFVHFSAKEYILHQRSGNFISESQAHHNIAYSCVSYLLTSSQIFGSCVSEYESLLRVVLGFHGLHPYAHEFWHSHIARHAEMQAACHAPLSSDLVQQLGKLEKFRKVTVSRAFQRLLLDQKTILEVEKVLPPLHENQGTRMLLRDIRLFQGMINQNNSGCGTHHSIRKYEIENDPTLLSDINYHYQDILEQFLRTESLPGVDDQLLRASKEMYGDSAFLCHYRPCTNTSRGFSDVEKRDRHEATHIRSFKCGDKKCDFYAVGFATKTALQRHSEIYHSNIGQQMIMPIRQRRQPVNLRERFQIDGITRTSIASNVTDSTNNPSQGDLNHPRTFDQILNEQQEAHRQVLSLYKKSQNEDFTKRPKYAEVCKIMEGLSELSNKPSSILDLQKEQKRHEDWMRKGKKLFGKANVPLHILKSHMGHVLERNTDCFNINSDKPRVPLDSKLRSRGDTIFTNVFCICRRVEAGMMIECELCYEWYHGKCLKIARGKIKDDDKYTCPICDWRVRIPRDSARPKLEDLESWQDEIPLLPFQPDEEEILSKIINNAQEFRAHISPFCNPVMGIAEEVEIQRFYLRKIEGAGILLAFETNFFRQELYKWSPVAPWPPPIFDAPKSTRKPRPTKLQILMAQHGVNDP